MPYYLCPIKRKQLYANDTKREDIHKKTSARRYSIEHKADSFEVIATPCAQVIRFSARYDDFQTTLSGLADAINSLDKMWKEVTDLAKSKGISSVGQIVHFSDYKWAKLYD